MAWTKPKEKISPLDEWANFKNAIMMSDDLRAKEYLRMCDTWMGYTGQEKADAYRQWDEYYETCAVSEPAAVFHEMREALKKRNVGTVHNPMDRLTKERGTFNPVMKPKCIDPYLIRHNQTCSTYIRLTYAAKSGQEKKTQGTGIF